MDSAQPTENGNYGIGYDRGGKMWPISAWRRRRYELRYRAAWTLLLGQYTYEKLSPEQQVAVRERDRQYLVACGTTVAFRRGRYSQRFFPDYVIAMRSLGIPPALQGERWPIPEGVEMPIVAPSRWGLMPRGRGKVGRYWWKLFTHYRVLDRATDDARRDLANRGVDVLTADANPIDAVHHHDVDGQPVTWRQWWHTKSTAGPAGQQSVGPAGSERD